MVIALFSLSLIFIFSALVDCKYILSSNVPDRYDLHEVIFSIRRTVESLRRGFFKNRKRLLEGTDII